MKFLRLGILCLLVFAVTGLTPVKPKPKLNVLFIVADDLKLCFGSLWRSIGHYSKYR